MRYLLFLIFAFALACGSGQPEPGPVEEVTIPLELNELAFAAPIGPNARARVRQHPELAEETCKRGCQAVHARMHKVGPTPNGWKWECLCARSRGPDHDAQ